MGLRSLPQQAARQPTRAPVEARPCPPSGWKARRRTCTSGQGGTTFLAPARPLGPDCVSD
eukprot:9365831-Heterocapsa_arctica.AAC.1